MMSPRTLLTALLLVTIGCGGPTIASTGPAKVDLPVSDGLAKAKKITKRPRQSPPPSSSSREAPFPNVARTKLANGMGVDVVTIKTLPIVQVRVVVRAGAGYGGAAPGVAEVTAAMLKDGGTRALPSAELLRRIEMLGADLSVQSETDATVLTLALTKDKVDAGVALLSQVVREPRFDEAELKKLKGRMTDEVATLLRSRGSATARWLIFHELYPEGHPYRLHNPLPSQIAKIDSQKVREFHRRYFVPKATTLILAGDIDEPAAKELAQKHFGSFTGGEPPKQELASPKIQGDKPRVLIAHRPKSVQSDVFVAMLAPERTSDRWAEVRVANQILGGGVASRLFSDVREQRSLAYSTNAQIIEVAHGEQPLVAYAGTETSKTTDALTGLLDNIGRMKTAPPQAAEVHAARRYLSDVFAIYMETASAIANLVVTEEVFGLPAGYWDTYRQHVRSTEAEAVTEVANKLYGGKSLVVVAGDADAIGEGLARFGDVTVVDPEDEWKTLRTIPGRASASHR